MSFSNRKGFALPTVLIVSIIMLTILVSAVASNSAVRVALRDQHYNQLSQQAGDAGVTYAKACMAANGGTPQWSDAKPLKPNTDCNGDQISGFTCDVNSTDSRCSILIVDNYTVITFTVPAPLPDSTGGFTNISSKGSVSLLRKSDNTVWKQYGHTSKVSSVAVSAVSLDTHWKQISSGDEHTCGIASNDQVFCWGKNNYGQLGINTNNTDDKSAPTAVYTGGALSGLTIKSISANTDTTCAVASNNLAYCWGYNTRGQLGDNTTEMKFAPTAVYAGGALNGLTVKMIETGGEHTCAIASNDKLFCWGYNYYGQLGDNTTVDKRVPTAVYSSGALNGLTIKSIDVAYADVCAIASNDKAYCWGYNSMGRLGDNTTVDKSVPTAVYTSGALSGLTVKSVSNGTLHTCAIASNNQAYCWGYGMSGLLGDNTSVAKSVPTAVYTGGALNGLTLKSISVSGNHTCAIASNNQVYCWGSNSLGRLGDGTTTTRYIPTAVNTDGFLSGLTVNSVSSGGNHTCVIASNSQAYCWGSNNFGQLGDDSIIIMNEPSAIDTNGPLNGLTVKSISVGDEHTCVIASNNLPYCWGLNSSGQVGDNTLVDKTVPAAVYNSGALNGLTIKSISAGDDTTCVIASNDKAYCWGENNYGQLGDNTTVDKSVPTAVYASGALSGLTIKSISVGGYHTCAIASDNKIYCWGYNSYGQLGVNSTADKTVPTAAYSKGALSGVTFKSIIAGDLHTCAISSTNLAYCWGANNIGQLGDNTTVNKPIPTAVYASGALSGLTINTINSGENQACVIASNIQTYCWGNNSYGQLGVNSVLNKYVPTAIYTAGALAGLTISSINSGYYHTCAVASNNQAYCWGNNARGQLGDNTYIDKLVPTAIHTAGALSGLGISSIDAGGDFDTCAIASNNQAYCWGRNNYGQLGVSGRLLKTYTPIGVKTVPGMPIESGSGSGSTKSIITY